MVSGRARVECPFCKKIGVTAFHKPSFLQGKTSRISAGAKTSFHRVRERYFIQGDCPNCGAKNKDLQAWFDGTYQDDKQLSHEERIRRMKEAGFPTRIEFNTRAA